MKTNLKVSETREAPSSGKRRIEIRMYNVGFGDSFLLKIPTAEGDRRILVDCGYHSQGKGRYSDQELVKQIVGDLNGNSLDVVLATHRHQDHISAFGEKALWANVPVNEVWLPFTANPRADRDEPELAAWNTFLEQACGFIDPAGSLSPQALGLLAGRNPDEISAANFMLWNARANQPAMDTLLKGFRRADGQASRRRFLPEAKEVYPSEFETSVLPGVKIHVLGPPTDPKYRKNLRVPASWGINAASLGVGIESPGSIFSSEWQVPASSLPPSLPFQEKTLQTIRLFNDDLIYAAKGVDSFLNGESVVLLVEFGSARLLLPGDAEVGSWTMIMNNPTALGLVASATFLKVGHHGSHNATPLSLIQEHLSHRMPAMISTLAGDGTYRNGIPYDNLLAALAAKKIPFVRSDAQPGAPASVFRPDPDGRWIDCFVDC